MSSELQNISIKSRSIDFNSLTGINFSSGSGITYGSQFSPQSIDLNNVSLSGNLDLSNVVLSGNINTQFISSIFENWVRLAISRICGLPNHVSDVM